MTIDITRTTETGAGTVAGPTLTRGRLMDVIRAGGGNFFEQYDFFVYGFYASYIGKVFFPNANPYASLMLSFATFGVGFLMRPLGAIFLGAYVDRHGRRKGLLLSLALMALGTLSIAATPGYATLGLLAPIIILIGRLLQGFSAGVELGGVSVYLAEIAPPGQIGFYTAWQSASQQLAAVCAAAIGAFTSFVLMPADMAAWGWRVPLIVGCFIVPLILWLRGSLLETTAFSKLEKARTASDIFRMTAQYWPLILIGMALSILTTTTFYLITTYTPTFGKEALHLDPTMVLVVTACVGFSNFAWLPIGGAISDRIGRYPLLFGISALAIVTAYPGMTWLVAAPSVGRMFAVLLLFSSYFGLYNGAAIALLTEIMPATVRTTGVALAFSLATAIFGGFTPLVSTYLIQTTGDKASPAWWLTLAAVVSFAGTLAAKRWAVQHKPQTAI